MKHTLFIAIVLMVVMTSCQRQLGLNSFVKKYEQCTDSLITYYSGEEWEGLKTINTMSYSWGFDNEMAKGTVTFFDQKGIGKGTVLRLENEDWVVEKMTYTRPSGMSSKGSPNPIPETYNVKLYLKKICL